MWNDFFRNGGFGMYPTSIFAFCLIAVSVLYLLRPERRYAPVVLSAGIMTLLAGALGCAVGFVTTIFFVRTLPPAEQFTVTLVGIAESLNNIILALIVCVLAALLAFAGTLRSARGAAPSAMS